MELWFHIRAHKNVASWYDAALHALGNTDVSFIGSRGVVRRPSGSAEVVRAAADYLAEWMRSHINVKEAFALYEVSCVLVDSRPNFLRASTIIMNVDNKTIFHDVQTGRAQNELIDNLIRKLF